MKKQQMKIIQIVLALLILGAAVIYLSTVPSGNDARKSPDAIDVELVKSLNPDYEEISVKKAYANGEHVISGVLILPTPCHKIIPEIIIMESYPEQVEVNLLVVDEGGACAQVLTETVFEARFKASELATVRGLLHNEPIEFIEE